MPLEEGDRADQVPEAALRERSTATAVTRSRARDAAQESERGRDRVTAVASPARPEPMASQRDVRNRIDAVKNIQKITRAMEMVAAARLRRAEQRIEALRPYADAIRRMTRQAAQAAGDVPRAADPRRARAASAPSACCWSPATAGWRARSTRKSSARASAPAASTPPRGTAPCISRPGAACRLVAGLPRARGRRRASPASSDRPSYADARRDRRTADGRLRRRRGRSGRDLLQRVHLADLPGREARDAAAAPARDDPRRRPTRSRRRCGGRRAQPRARGLRARSRGDPLEARARLRGDLDPTRAARVHRFGARRAHDRDAQRVGERQHADRGPTPSR